MFDQYIDVILKAAIFFPVLAGVITLPYLIYNYRKHGSVLSIRVPIIYSFILYLLCCYFLVILPLPSQEFVAKVTGPTMQLIPFTFVADIVKNAHLAAAGGIDDVIKSVIINKAFYQVIMNVFMFLPLGIYLKYYFGFGLAKTVFCSFLLSLFFELTQLSGLYFIYPRGYRLFDVDDLMINTLGGLLGYLAAIPLTKVLPTKAEIDKASYRRSQKVSILRRMVSLICDFITLIIIMTVAGIALRLAGLHLPDMGIVSTFGLAVFGYFGVLPIFTNSQTIGQKLTRMKIVRKNNRPARWYQHLLRIVYILIVFVIGPQLVAYLAVWAVRNHWLNHDSVAVYSLVLLATYGIMMLVMFIRACVRKPLFYERWSGTRLISTTAIKPDGGSGHTEIGKSDNTVAKDEPMADKDTNEK